MAVSSKEARKVRRRRADGERTHAAILEVATRVASVEGINGLTIGRLAEELGVSKSGLYAHFGSKEQLQLETIETAMSIFEAEVMAPVFEAPEGMAQLEAFFERYFSYLERDVFPGGCFFAALLAEMDARTGPIHDAVVSIERSWQEELWKLARQAQRTGEIRADIDVKQVTFELYACLELANYHFVLFREPEVLERGRRAVKEILNRARAENDQVTGK